MPWWILAEFGAMNQPEATPEEATCILVLVGGVAAFFLLIVAITLIPDIWRWWKNRRQQAH